MDVHDDSFDFRATLVDKTSGTFGFAVLIFGADYITSDATRHMILGIYVMYAILNIKGDVRMSIIQGLSLAPFWFWFYGRPFSLLSLPGAFLITKTTMMTFGNISLWVAIPGVRFDAYSIVMGNAELAAYFLTWALLWLTTQVIRFLLIPFRELSPFLQAFVATVTVQLIVVLLDNRAETLRDLRSRLFQSQQNAVVLKTAMVPTSPYTYSRRLTSGMEIRLLKLHPCVRGDGIYCEIIYHPLEKLLDYEAISYTWGNTTEKTSIVVDDQILETSVKVSDMLRSLRNTWKPRMLWIDFICINQEDTDEKNHQVQLMRHVYHRAVTVVIWLDPLPDMAEAVDLLVEVARHTQLGGLTAQEGFHVYGQRSQRSRVLALARFLANDYFNRLWVVQEIASAQKVKVFCGNQAIEWNDLSSTLMFFGNPEMVRFLQRTEEMDIISCNQDSLRHGHLIKHTKACMSEGVSYSLAHELSSFRSFKCRDPRDKVFALLGLIRDADHPLILPDYYKDEVQVYKDVARYVFTVEQTSQKLLALAISGVGNYRRLKSLPSWVPDWASNMRTKDDQSRETEPNEHSPALNQNRFSYHVQTISNYGNSYDVMRSNKPHFEKSTRELGYRAALGTDPQIEMVNDDVLGIRGFLVDEIDSLTPVFDLLFDEDMKISHVEMTLTQAAWFKEAEALASRASLPHPTSEHIENIVWRTMTGDRLLEDDDRNVVHPIPREYAIVYRAFKAAAGKIQEAIDLVGPQLVIEVRDIALDLLIHTAGGRSASELWMEVLCGRSGHLEVWKFITHRTKFADSNGPLPDFPETSGDALFWSKKFAEFFEKEDTRVIGEKFILLFQLFMSPDLDCDDNEEQTGLPQVPDGSTHQDVLRHDELSAFETKAFRNSSRYAQMMSRFSEAIRLSFERRLCLTRNGHIGLVPPLTRVGDRVCILFGGDAPYLVRPEEGIILEEPIKELRCQLVGECYMHGMMDGEMMHLAENDTLFRLL